LNRVEWASEGLPADFEPYLARCAEFAERALARIAGDGWELSLLFGGDAELRALNSEHRGKDEPTDVLSFPAREGYDFPELPNQELRQAGDIAISIPFARENASFFGVDPDEEVQRLIVHGILHLMGSDHASNDPDEPMLVEQEAILRELRRRGGEREFIDPKGPIRKEGI
jgi:probable rRNA maturation factor